MRSWLPICVALTLCGCNMVHSDRPLFTTADAVGAPRFKPGVWAAPDQGCEFDPNLPVKTWPDCAHGEAGTKGEPGMELLVAAGNSLVLQYGGKGDDGTSTSSPNYYYFGLEAPSLDNRGWITAINPWPVACGPPRRYGQHYRGPKGTRHPWPGLTMDADGNNCTAESPAAVRAAAILSRPKGRIPAAAYWVRDGDR